MARPKKNITKSKTITVHCSVTDYIFISAKASKCKLPMSQFLLDAGMGRQLEARLSAEEIEIFRQLIGMANNLNQIAKRLHQNKILKMKTIDDLQHISDLLKKFK